MIGLDTNILARFLTKDADDPAQAEASRAVIAQCTPARPGYINRIVLCELVWVLSHTYGEGRSAVGDVIDWLLRTSEFMVEDALEVRQALDLYRTGKADYTDCLLAVLNERAGCAGTRTFDRNAVATSPHFRLAGT